MGLPCGHVLLLVWVLPWMNTGVWLQTLCQEVCGVWGLLAHVCICACSTCLHIKVYVCAILGDYRQKVPLPYKQSSQVVYSSPAQTDLPKEKPARRGLQPQKPAIAF